MRVVLLCLFLSLAVQAAAPLSPRPRPGLFFREDWKDTPAETPVTQAHVAHPDLLVSRYGPAEAKIKKSHHDQPANDPYYIWSGDADAGWAIAPPTSATRSTSQVQPKLCGGQNKQGTVSSALF